MDIDEARVDCAALHRSLTPGNVAKIAIEFVPSLFLGRWSRDVTPEDFLDYPDSVLKKGPKLPYLSFGSSQIMWHLMHFRNSVMSLTVGSDP